MKKILILSFVFQFSCLCFATERQGTNEEAAIEEGVQLLPRALMPPKTEDEQKEIEQQELEINDEFDLEDLIIRCSPRIATVACSCPVLCCIYCCPVFWCIPCSVFWCCLGCKKFFGRERRQR